MSDETVHNVQTNLNPVQSNPRITRAWLLRRICSQNPFYLLSVCFVLHATANWFHADSGIAFSPWPLLALTAGYTLLLAMTGFVIIRFGQVWDDARSILLIILLLFVQLSLLFDETLVREPATGRTLLFGGWFFAVALSELLLGGLRIRLPFRFRIPYHLFLALLFFYPILLVSEGKRLPTETVSWRIWLFPVTAALIFLTLIPAIRRGKICTRLNGTPWLWPWYPWSIFVFLGVCVCFRAYALSQSFDPVLGETSQSAMAFSTAFGIYFLIPLIFAFAVLLLEIGLVERQIGTTQWAMMIPLVCLILSVPSSVGSGPYNAFLRTLTFHTGSYVWLTMLGMAAFYGVASIRRVSQANGYLAMTLLIATRVGPQTVSLQTLTAVDCRPLFLLTVIQLFLGILRRDSRRTFTALCIANAGIHFWLSSEKFLPLHLHLALGPALFIFSVLFVGGIFNDEFAWFLRLAGAPLMVIATCGGCVYLEQTTVAMSVWTGPVFVASMTLIGLAYGSIVRIHLYRLSSLLCAVIGTAGLTEILVVYFIRTSGWQGAKSFVFGVACLILAATISSWKAGWLRNVARWLRQMLIVPPLPIA